MSTVIPPAAMNYEWIGTPSDECVKLYTAFYDERKLSRDNESWSTRAVRILGKQAFRVAQAGATSLWGGVKGFLVGAAVQNDLAYQTVEKVAEAGNAVVTKWTRKPIEHTRVEEATKKLREIKECKNPQIYIDLVQASYRKWLTGSKSSADLMKKLNGNTTPGEKIDNMIDYINEPAKDHKGALKNNGKDLCGILICTAEQSKIEASMAEG